MKALTVSMPSPFKSLCTLLPVCLLTVLACASVQAAEPLESAIKTRIDGQQDSIKAQQKIDILADQTTTLLEEYRQLIQQTQSLHSYNNQLQRLVDNQEKQLQSFERQFVTIRVTQRKIVPLMLRMIEVLEDFVKLDLPFLPDERIGRLGELHRLMDDPELSLPEKYRRLNEAYQIEMDYGRTIEAYSGALVSQGEQRTVDFLRLGRVALYYNTFDGLESGYWDSQSRSWEKLPSLFNKAIHRGLQIARNEIPPDLMTLPLPLAEVPQ